MPAQDQVLDFLEEQIPALSASAVVVAYWQTLAAGHSVLETEGETLIEMFPDGTRRVVKVLEPGAHLPLGTRLELP